MEVDFSFKKIALAFLALNFGPAAPPPSSKHSLWAVTGFRVFLKDGISFKSGGILPVGQGQ